MDFIQHSLVVHRCSIIGINIRLFILSKNSS